MTLSRFYILITRMIDIYGQRLFLVASRIPVSSEHASCMPLFLPRKHPLHSSRLSNNFRRMSYPLADKTMTMKASYPYSNPGQVASIPVRRFRAPSSPATVVRRRATQEIYRQSAIGVNTGQLLEEALRISRQITLPRPDQDTSQSPKDTS